MDDRVEIMIKILVLAGTVEGRKVAEYIAESGVPFHVCVATQYGEKLLPKGDKISTTAIRLNQDGMKDILRQKNITLVLDATHPHAVLVSQNMRQVCQQMQIEYIRIIRQNVFVAEKKGLYVDTVEEAVEFLINTSGNILLTTGSKDLVKFTRIPHFEKRVYARVLSTLEVVTQCQKLGFEGKNLICMQGPFSEALNYAMLEQINAKYLVTKESGAAGGFEEKIRAAQRVGVQAIIIRRPCKEEGISLALCIEELERRFTNNTIGMYENRKRDKVGENV